jgi:hypothetical protein
MVALLGMMAIGSLLSRLGGKKLPDSSLAGMSSSLAVPSPRSSSEDNY